MKKGDQVVLVKPYTINGIQLTSHDQCSEIPVGATAVVVGRSSATMASVLWDDYKSLSTRRIDDDCLEVIDPPSQEEIDAAIRSITGGSKS